MYVSTCRFHFAGARYSCIPTLRARHACVGVVIGPPCVPRQLARGRGVCGMLAWARQPGRVLIKGGRGGRSHALYGVCALVLPAVATLRARTPMFEAMLPAYGRGLRIKADVLMLLAGLRLAAYRRGEG